MTRRIISAVVLVALAVLLAGCRADDDLVITARFETINNLFEGSEVRVLGLQVGEVERIEPHVDHVDVVLRVDADAGQPIPADATASLVPAALLGERFVQLDPPYQGGPQMEDGAVLGTDRTSSPADVDQILASFENFLESLDREALADLVDALAGTVSDQGQGLNDLIGDAHDTVRVLADASEDLNEVVAEFADLNETLATRDDRIGSTLEELSATLVLLHTEREEIIGTVQELHRLTAELQPLLDEHSDPLVDDLERLTTSLSTVERNMERVGDTILGGRRLFEGAGRAFEFEEARLPLHDQIGELVPLIGERIAQRLVGVCLRLDLDECADPEFFAELLAELLAGDAGDEDGMAQLEEVVEGLVDGLPDEARQAIEEGREDLFEPPAREQPREPAEPPGDGLPDLPAPDSPLREPDDDEGLLDELSERRR